jgi:hypothetical protein
MTHVRIFGIKIYVRNQCRELKFYGIMCECHEIKICNKIINTTKYDKHVEILKRLSSDNSDTEIWRTFLLGYIVFSTLKVIICIVAVILRDIFCFGVELGVLI